MPIYLQKTLMLLYFQFLSVAMCVCASKALLLLTAGHIEAFQNYDFLHASNLLHNLCFLLHEYYLLLVTVLTIWFGAAKSANSAKKKARILWTCYAIRWTGKKNDAGKRRWKEEKRTTKEKMDGRDTWSNWNEAGWTKRYDNGKKNLEENGQDNR